MVIDQDTKAEWAASQAPTPDINFELAGFGITDTKACVNDNDYDSADDFIVVNDGRNNVMKDNWKPVNGSQFLPLGWFANDERDKKAMRPHLSLKHCLMELACTVWTKDSSKP